MPRRTTIDSRNKPAPPQRRGLLSSVLLDLLTPRGSGVRPARSEEAEPVVRWTRSADTSSSGSLAWLLGIVLIAAAAYFSLPYLSQPTLRLKVDPPAQFVSINAQSDINEVDWGRAYWRCARELESRYIYAAPLPEEPPPQFHISQESTIPRDKADKFRQLYWAKVQKAWLNPDAWERSRTPAFRWFW